MKADSWSLALVAAAGTVSATGDGWSESSAAPAYGAESSSVVSPASSSAPAYPAASSGWASPASSSDPAYPAESSSAVWAVPSSSEAGAWPTGTPGGPVIVTNTKTLTKYVCPCDPATRTPGEVYTTQTTTEWTSTCSDTGHEATYTWGDWTSLYTSYSVSTLTDTITVTLTEPYPTSTETDPAGYPTGSAPGGYPTGSAPAGYPSGSAPAGYPSGSAPAGYPSGSAPAGYPSGTAPPYPSYSGSSTIGTAYPTGTHGACVPCEGQPGNNPEEWCGYDINTNWYEYVPKTCKTREYWWTITEETVSPDGVSRTAFLVNGQMPGPKIEANWGDEIIVHLTNGFAPSLGNGTSLHFHGIRQNYTNEMDGVSSITQCPIAPGQSMTYKWTAESYGTSWWHSHFALQTYEGIFGPLVINGPSAMTYDDDVVVMAQDWNHATVDSLYYPSQLVSSTSSGPQTLDTGLINGMNVWNGTDGEVGQRFEWTIESGKSYRIRLVNTAIQSTFVFYVDSHKLNVIAMDFVPIHPYETDSVTINIGQRYDLILKADQTPGDYWMRADNQQPCGQLRNQDIKAIVHYAEGPNAQPSASTPPLGYAPTCLDEPAASLVPIVALTAGGAEQTISESVVIAPNNGNPNLYKWTLSGTTFYSEWENPTLQSIVNDGTIPDTSGNLAISVPNLGEWVYVIIETVIPLPHPIHLHGHDFFVVAQGLGSYSDSTPLQLVNPPRRDVATMPADPTTGSSGFLVLAFETTNPGVWLMHCHIGWHNAMGFALQIIENLEGIAATVKHQDVLDETCDNWGQYANAYNVFAATDFESGV